MPRCPSRTRAASTRKQSTPAHATILVACGARRVVAPGIFSPVGVLMGRPAEVDTERAGRTGDERSNGRAPPEPPSRTGGVLSGCDRLQSRAYLSRMIARTGASRLVGWRSPRTVPDWQRSVPLVGAIR